MRRVVPAADAATGAQSDNTQQQAILAVVKASRSGNCDAASASLIDGGWRRMDGGCVADVRKSCVLAEYWLSDRRHLYYIGCSVL